MKRDYEMELKAILEKFDAFCSGREDEIVLDGLENEAIQHHPEHGLDESTDYSIACYGQSKPLEVRIETQDFGYSEVPFSEFSVQERLMMLDDAKKSLKVKVLGWLD